MSMQVTDILWYDERFKKHRRGYYMDEFLAINLMGIPGYLAKSYDVVGIISGHGKVRVGKSTITQQIAYFVAWMLAGGSMGQDNATGRWFVARKPEKKVRFTLEDNIVFTPEDLQEKARELYEKYGRNQIIVYDEGRAGLDSAAAMSAINKAMMDFFQECGQYGHIILIVLPNFFKLHEDYAISRSIFLVDAYTGKNMSRGFFNFYNEAQKEMLYIQGRKKSGTKNKYGSTSPSFNGRFSGFLPINKDDYERAKQEALKQKEVARKEQKWKRQRDACIYLLSREANYDGDIIASEIFKLTGEKVTPMSIKWALSDMAKRSGDK